MQERYESDDAFHREDLVLRRQQADNMKDLFFLLIKQSEAATRQNEATIKLLTDDIAKQHDK